MKTNKTKILSILAILFAGILWGCIGLFVRPLNDSGLTSMDIVALRAIVTTLILFIVLVIYKRDCLKIKLKDIWCFIGTGILSITFFNFCYFKCMTLTSLAVAAILLYTSPVIVMLLSLFLFNEKLNKKKIAALIMTFIGCALVTGVFESDTNITVGGILIGLGAGLGYALYSIFGKYAINRGYNSITITFYTFVFSTIGSLFLCDAKKVYQYITLDIKCASLSIAFGIVCTILPYLFYTLGLKNVENGKAAIIASIEPVAATLLGFIVYHETLSAFAICGIVLVISALAICSNE